MFDISLTVHLGIILVKNQLDALYSMYLLFHLSTCFEYLVLIIRRAGREGTAVPAYQAVTYIVRNIPDAVLIQFDSPDDEH